MVTEQSPNLVVPYASAADYEECRRWHRKFGTTYYFASLRFRPLIRQRTHAVYGFVRVPDEWVDNPGLRTTEEQILLLRGWRRMLVAGIEGETPSHPVMRAFCDVVRDCRMPLSEPLCFMDAMEMDLTIERYQTYADLQGYMRGSACAVGLMMCSALEAGDSPCMIEAAKALGEAMQLTNFLRDVGEDLQRGRIYLPLEDMAQFGVSEEDVQAKRLTDGFRELMRFEIARARRLYQDADRGIPMLPSEGQKAVRLASNLYAMILDRIEDRNYDVFSARARTTRWQKLRALARIVASP